MIEGTVETGIVLRLLVNMAHGEFGEHKFSVNQNGGFVFVSFEDIDGRVIYSVKDMIADAYRLLSLDMTANEFVFEYIKITKRERPKGRKTNIYDVINKEHGDLLGTIRFDAGWWQFIFSTEPDCKFSAGCMNDISGFLTMLTNIWRSGLKKKEKKQ